MIEASGVRAGLGRPVHGHARRAGIDRGAQRIVADVAVRLRVGGRGGDRLCARATLIEDHRAGEGRRVRGLLLGALVCRERVDEQMDLTASD